MAYSDFDFNDLMELASMSKKIFKDTIEASREKVKSLTNEAKGLTNQDKNTIMDDNNKRDNYSWVKENDLVENFSGNFEYSSEGNSNLECEIVHREKLELERKIEYERIKKVLSKKKLEEERVSIDLDFKEKNVVQAVVYSEIFGEPRAKRRRRRW
ncbi:hypothetical protein HBE96_19670 [Clostridium sp. P21]|uniref:Uncharacterized protein n=1 Tax=Clostridium muellerianum TaxID=2716538 RepID=A0A7Y0EJW3_9CLOT|nr:hypothetical protein [Clostridium muellerianum]NMM64824.1 hypothetical protein [Clostridium muellerianum]